MVKVYNFEGLKSTSFQIYFLFEWQSVINHGLAVIGRAIVVRWK